MYKILQQDYYQSISSSLKSKFYTAANENHNYQVQKFQNDPWEINSKKTEPLQVNGLETDGKKTLKVTCSAKTNVTSFDSWSHDYTSSD